MAKVEQGRKGGTRIKRTGAKAPVSAHPAFAVIVALWFAALLGLGSLILPIVLIEKLVVATGLPSVLSAAQPPLGFTARAGIALLGTVAGAVIGLVVALQVARSNRTAAANRSTNPADLVRRPPVNAHAELGSDGFDGNGTSRRRALALAADEMEEPASDYREAAYAPSQPEDFELDDALVLEDDIAPAADHTAAPMPFAPPSPMIEPTAFAVEDDLAEEVSFAAESEDQFVEADEPAPAPFAQPAPFSSPAPFAQPSDADAAEPLAFAPPSQQAEPAPAAVREDLAELGLVQLVQKLEATIEKHRAWLIEQNRRAAEAAAATADDLPEPAALATEEAFGTIAPDEAAQAREAYFDAPAPAPVATDENEDEGEDESETPGASDTHPAPIAALASFTPEHDNEDEDDHEAAELSASFALPFTKPATNRTVLRQVFQPETVNGEDDTDDNRESFASLNRDFAQRPLRAVRIEEPEAEGAQEAAVVFPGQSTAPADRSFDPPTAVPPSSPQPQGAMPAASSEETDRALRDALRNLQRMGKAS